MEQHTDKDVLHKRLRKIVGQVQAIDRMIDKDLPCEDILVQISATKAALHSCGKILLEDHIKNCVQESYENGDVEKTIEEFTVAIDRFSSMC